MSGTINKTILREYQDMNLQSFSDGQIEISFPDENELSKVRVTLLPTAGYYKDGKFEFAIDLGDSYPEAPPSITCLTKVFHPNICYEGSICFNILNDEFDSCLRLVDYAHALLWLLYQPNLDSRLNGDCPEDLDEFAELVRTSIVGGDVAGQHFSGSLACPIPEPPPTPPVYQRPSSRLFKTTLPVPAELVSENEKEKEEEEEEEETIDIAPLFSEQYDSIPSTPPTTPIFAQRRTLSCSSEAITSSSLSLVNLVT